MLKQRVEDRLEYTPRGFSYIKVTPHEIFSWGGLCICNGCGKRKMEDMNLCFVLLDVYCDKCWKEILERQQGFSQEDVDYDLALQKEQSLDWYRFHLDEDFRDNIMRKVEERNE